MPNMGLLYYGTFFLTGFHYLLLAAGLWLSTSFSSEEKAAHPLLPHIPNSLAPSRKEAREILLSLSSTLIISLYVPLLAWLNQKGLTRIYSAEGSVFTQPYFYLSIVLGLLISDTVFFWAHKFMHLKWAFPWTHKAHHQFRDPSPWGGFSFHPMEALILILVPVVPPLLIPMSGMALVINHLILVTWLIWLHSGVELRITAPFRKNRGGLIFSSSHHNLHHQQSSKNFSLFFTFWDKLTRTEWIPFGRESGYEWPEERPQVGHSASLHTLPPMR